MSRLPIPTVISASSLRPRPCSDAGTLAAEESVRATLAEGGGAVLALDIPESGKYRLDLYGLDRTFTTRLEDAEGWPLTVPSPLSMLERTFAAGRYRLVVLPEAVEARLVARLRRSDAVVEEVRPKLMSTE